jgi:hypothetical protein
MHSTHDWITSRQPVHHGGIGVTGYDKAAINASPRMHPLHVMEFIKQTEVQSLGIGLSFTHLSTEQSLGIWPVHVPPSQWLGWHASPNSLQSSSSMQHPGISSYAHVPQGVVQWALV